MFNAPNARSHAIPSTRDRWDCHLGALFVSAIIILCFACQLLALALALGAIVAPGFI